jgi:lysophospholipase L1-like esterase
MHHNNAWHSAQGMARIIKCIRNAPLEPGMPIPDIIVVAPPPIVRPSGAIARKFEGAERKCAGLASELAVVCTAAACQFFDAGAITTLSRIDGIHFDENQHLALGEAIAELVLTKHQMAPPGMVSGQ